MYKVFSPILLLLLCLCALPAAGRGGERVTLLQWNIWQEGTQVPGGYDAIVDELARLKPDFVTFSEVRNYRGRPFTARLCRDLAVRGVQYHSFYSYDSGLLSRYPITDTTVVYPCRDDHGSIYRLACEAKGRRWAVYTAHLDYLNDTYYEVRGYDGNTWAEIPVLTDSAEIVRRNARSKRDEALTAFLSHAARDEAEGRVVVLGGDFNEPSWLDWTPATRYLYDHHGVVMAWPATRRLAEAGYTDVWRALFPDPVSRPGFTYPADNPAVSPTRLSWAPLADERERIDYLFVKGRGVSVSDAKVYGPKGSIAYGRRVPNPVGGEPFLPPLGVWPSDHKGLWAEILVK